MTQTIVVVGSINTDLVINTPRLPHSGETLKGSDFHVIAGGKGANQAVAAVRQGGLVQMIGCVGDDSFGMTQQQNLRNEGIGLSGLSILPGQKTGVAIILIDENHQNSIVISPEANHELTVQKLEQHTSIIAQADMLLCQLEVPLETVIRAVEIAHENKTTVLLNPAPATRLPESLLKKVDYLIPNETEIALLSGIEVMDLESAEDAILTLQNLGAKQVLLTLGDQGVAWVGKGIIQHQAAPSIQAIDTTAAGDTFIGSLAVALGEGKPLASAIRFAQHAAALAVNKLGAQTSIPTKDDVVAFMDSF